MDHLVQFTISVDDAHIAQMVEKEAAKALMDEVIKVCHSHDEPECAPGYLSFFDDMVDYRHSPISAILALPEREVT